MNQGAQKLRYKLQCPRPIYIVVFMSLRGILVVSFDMPALMEKTLMTSKNVVLR